MWGRCRGWVFDGTCGGLGLDLGFSGFFGFESLSAGVNESKRKGKRRVNWEV